MRPRNGFGQYVSVDWRESFWARVQEAPNGCWLWIGSRNNVDYPVFNWKEYGPRNSLAHRIAYEEVVGLIPDGLTLDHLCRVPLCVNPAHLEPVTMRENVRRGGNAAKTHCKRGHLLEGDNLYIIKATGYRRCRACQAMKHQEWWASRAA